jgi:hypothetical protein
LARSHIAHSNFIRCNEHCTMQSYCSILVTLGHRAFKRGRTSSFHQSSPTRRFLHSEGAQTSAILLTDRQGRTFAASSSGLPKREQISQTMAAEYGICWPKNSATIRSLAFTMATMLGTGIRLLGDLPSVWCSAVHALHQTHTEPPPAR